MVEFSVFAAFPKAMRLHVAIGWIQLFLRGAQFENERFLAHATNRRSARHTKKFAALINHEFVPIGIDRSNASISVEIATSATASFTNNELRIGVAHAPPFILLALAAWPL